MCASSDDRADARDEARFVRHAGAAREGEADEAEPFTLRRAFSCAWSGIRYTLSTQRNLRIHLVFAAIAVVAGFALGIPASSWCAVVLCIVAVFALEIVNTAVESVVDLVSPDYHDLAKHAKDCAAGAVYIAALGSIVVALIVYIPRLFALLSAVLPQ